MKWTEWEVSKSAVFVLGSTSIILASLATQLN